MRMSKLPSLCLPGDSTTIRAASRDAKASGSKKRVQNVKDLMVVINTLRKAKNKDRVKTKAADAEVYKSYIYMRASASMHACASCMHDACMHHIHTHV